MELGTATRLLAATGNPGKLKEYNDLLRDLPLEVTSLEQVGISAGLEEVASSFEENARDKARAYAALSGLLTLADDSGLEVYALEGAPGVKSARYGGPGLSDEQRVGLLLKNLKGVQWDDRSGRFRCVIAMAWPSGRVETVSGTVEGIIQHEPKGTGGFGYDPVFYLPHLERTTAELSLEEKNGLSHRGKAARKAVELLRSVLLLGPALPNG